MAQPTKKDDKKLHAGTLTVKSDGSKQSNPPPTNELLETFCFEFDREQDSYEKKNALRTLEEISVDQPLAPPNESVERWEERAQRAEGRNTSADVSSIGLAKEDVSSIALTKEDVSSIALAKEE